MSGGELHWKHRPATPLRGRRVLLVDDIVDEGHTLAQVREWVREQGASEVRIAALTVKQHNRCVEGLRADYAGLPVPDRYVFGYGMARARPSSTTATTTTRTATWQRSAMGWPGTTATGR